ncbi:MAG TPA: hypothetical protein PLY52_07285 [Methanothrix sp.]|uniref:hypothetical protein n=1 Tax=Methanothrix sp. TaxID=90426 RepID=UPI002BDD798A|nr:hypothetical protein [Methanothrix sp.]MDI9417590.1 hypothetical protein [Euryarchaeota archaeon]HON36091.1 hypothetical protein [Methanothrix sp.]HRU75574.1 hypothetical protein [Methanothrix sp.]
MTHAILVHFVNRLYNYECAYEVRWSWDYPTILPVLINGKNGNPRCEEPWHWFYPLHK